MFSQNMDIHSNINVIFCSYLPIIILTVFLLSLNMIYRLYDYVTFYLKRITKFNIDHKGLLMLEGDMVRASVSF